MKDTLLIYWKWTWAFHRHYALCIVLQVIPTLTLKQRKELLGLSRSQTPVVQKSYVESTLTCLYQTIAVPSTITRQHSDVLYVEMLFRTFLRTYQDSYLSPASSSIIALATRISPSTTKEEYDEVLSASIAKELSAAITKFSAASINFNCIFASNPESRNIPFTDRMTEEPEVASDTYQIFCQLRKDLSNQYIFPSIGSKTVGSLVAENFWKAYHQSGCTFKHNDETFGVLDQVTTRDCMKLYVETGGYVEGPVEVRSSWKYAQIEPRVYYARGGSVIPCSQYLQPVVNRIIDAFPEVHRLNRFSPPDLPLEPQDVEVIYDYSSFTSTLDAVVEFVRYLANFFRGTPVILIDAVHGPVSVDLGDLFDQYNKDCNEYSSFDVSRILARWSAEVPLMQHTCGMLGVEGNIFLATILHGIHLRFVAGLGRSRCVGDDARFHKSTEDGLLTQDNRDTMNWILSGLGLINDSKVGVFEAEVDPVLQAFRYVKRPLHRDIDFMVEGFMFDIPSLIPLFPLGDTFHTVLPSSTHPCRSTFKSIVRLLKVMKLHNYTLVERKEEVSILADHVQHLVTEIRQQDPEGLHSPFSRSNLNTRYTVPPVTMWGVWSYEEWMLHELGFEDEVRFLKRGGEDDEICDGRVGSTMIKEASRGRSFLEKLGYLSREDLYDTISIAVHGTETMMEYLCGDYRSVYKFTVIEAIPPWYIHIPRTL